MSDDLGQSGIQPNLEIGTPWNIAYFGYTGPINSDGVTRITSALNSAVNSGYDEVYLCISSLGGYVADGIYLYNHARGLPIKFTIHNLGTVASIAVSSFVAASTRYCSAHAVFLIHPTSIGTTENMTWERLTAFQQGALADDTRTENILRENTTIPDDVLGARRVRDVHIPAEQALQWGIVHEVREFALPSGHKLIQI
jgi:ATP-dependent Clp protease protease subunit